MHTWPAHTTKLVAVHEASSYVTCGFEQLGKPVVDSFMLEGTVYAYVAKSHR